ncbi:MAG: hypothetical protein A2622_06010 [Bdellovibrionales bacterium RIFCSPHIGHO2_01_FULL_40_29]|nr:MAG: hypothetical protein A2622_06010 [Bdellovibrionales bacterium RIFCSPHIGHO2_01_FULL_40_29]OFZ35005.1 MAG: hypothetical protein A3D17_06360 [Bdellovibrionales bacterium RIFCSPHIGHO2_02_FULL_40_15]
MAFKILVVDDELDMRNLFSLFLEKEGYEVTRASNGKEAYEIVQTSKPDLIISDIRMPVWDGVELFDRITQMAAPHIPILFVSGYADYERRDFHKNPNFMGFVSKPIRRQKLIESVKEIQLKTASGHH